MSRGLRFGPPPGLDELDGLRVHEVVRRWPETLAPLRGGGLVPEAGGRSLEDLDEADAVLDLIIEVTAWRDG